MREGRDGVGGRRQCGGVVLCVCVFGVGLAECVWVVCVRACVCSAERVGGEREGVRVRVRIGLGFWGV